MSGANGQGPAHDPQLRIFVRPIGIPLPLAFSALAVGSLLVAGRELGWLGPDSAYEIGIVLVALVFPLQLLSAVLGFFARDPVAGTGIALVSAAWLLAGLDRIVPAAGSEAFGFTLVAVAAVMVVPVVTASFGKLAVAVLMGMTATRFALSGVFALSGAAAIGDLAGIVGLGVFALALYCALALELEAIGRPALPLLRGSGRGAARDRDLGDEFAGIEHEAGVRRGL